MKKTHYIFLIIFGFNFSFGADDNPALKHNGFSLSSIEKQIHYTSPGYELQQTIHNGVSYTKPEIIGGGAIVEPGQPYLPTVNTFYAVDVNDNNILETIKDVFHCNKIVIDPCQDRILS